MDGITCVGEGGDSARKEDLVDTPIDSDFAGLEEEVGEPITGEGGEGGGATGEGGEETGDAKEGGFGL